MWKRTGSRITLLLLEPPQVKRNGSEEAIRKDSQLHNAPTKSAATLPERA